MRRFINWFDPRPEIDLSSILKYPWRGTFSDLTRKSFFFRLELSHRGVHIQSLALDSSENFRREWMTVKKENLSQTILQHTSSLRIMETIKSPSILKVIDPCSFWKGGFSNGSLYLKTAGRVGWNHALVALRNPSLYRESIVTLIPIRRGIQTLSFNNRSKPDPNLQNFRVKSFLAFWSRRFQAAPPHPLWICAQCMDESGKNLFRDQLYIPWRNMRRVLVPSWKTYRESFKYP